MKIFSAALSFVLLVAVCVPVHAQDISRFDIPFAFTAGNKVLPAGTYMVQEMLPSNTAVWTISNNQGGTSVFITNSMISPLTSHQVSLVFRRDGGEYSLIEFWQDGARGRSVIRPNTSRTHIAQGKSATVEIAALHQ